MTISKALNVVPQVLCAGSLLLLCSCEPHSADETRAFWSAPPTNQVHYEHQLHEMKVIPQHERFYFKEAAHRHDPVMLTNLANPRDFESVFRDMQPQYPKNVVIDSGVKWPEPELHGHGDDHGAEKKDHGHDGHTAKGHDLEASEVPGSSHITPEAKAPHASDPGVQNPHEVHGTHPVPHPGPAEGVETHHTPTTPAPQERRSFFRQGNSSH